MNERMRVRDSEEGRVDEGSVLVLQLGVRNVED